MARVEERRNDIVSYVASHAEEQVRFLIGLCEQNSHTHNKAGTDGVARMILDRLDGALPRHRIIPQTETGDHHVLGRGETARAIYLVGHLDTVFPPDHTFQRCRLEGDVLAGPGCCDMKGGLAVIVYALKALEAIGLLESLRLTLILNADEEIGSVGSRQLFEQERERARLCLVAECAGPGGEIVVSRNGKLAARIDCHGSARHVSAGTHEKSSAVLELARRIVDLESLNGALPGVSVNVGRLEGGLGASTVPDHAFAVADFRWEQDSQGRDLMDLVRQRIARPVQPGCRTELAILNSRPAMPLRPGTEDLFRDLLGTARALGQTIRPEHRRGTSDANFFGSAGVPTLDGFGPVGQGDHTPGECIRVSSLRERSALLALFLADLAGASG